MTRALQRDRGQAQQNRERAMYVVRGGDLDYQARIAEVERFELQESTRSPFKKTSEVFSTLKLLSVFVTRRSVS